MLMALGMTVQRDVKEEVKLEHGTMVCVDLQTRGAAFSVVDVVF